MMFIMKAIDSSQKGSEAVKVNCFTREEKRSIRIGWGILQTGVT